MHIDYSNYGYFGHLCEVPQNVLNNLIEYYDILEKSNADLTFGVNHYKQWYLQTNTVKKQNYDLGYTIWQDNGFLDITKQFFENYVTKILRFRYSWLHKDKEVKYHSSHMLPRIHIPLNDSGSIFFVKDKQGTEHSYELTYGHAHFINVTMPHKVVATKTMDRKNSFFCFAQFKNKIIENKFLK